VLTATDGWSLSSKGPAWISGEADLVAVGRISTPPRRSSTGAAALYDAGGYTLTQEPAFPHRSGGSGGPQRRRGRIDGRHRSLRSTRRRVVRNAAGDGAGLLNLGAALRGTAAAFPTSLSFEQ